MISTARENPCVGDSINSTFPADIPQELNFAELEVNTVPFITPSLPEAATWLGR
jgi:hypothetical protein